MTTAQIGTPTTIYQSHLDHPTDVVAADLDNDGDNDIITSGANSGLVWYENQDNGSFNAHVIETGVNVTHLITEDFNSDNEPDLIVDINGDQAMIAWYRNEGVHFSNRRVLASNSWGINFKSLHRVDNDTLLDLVTVTSTGGSDRKLEWYKKSGGYFGDSNLITRISGEYREFVLENPSNIEMADLDNDRDQDLLTRTDYTDRGGLFRLLWYKNDGRGHFSQPDTISDRFSKIGLIRTIDLNKDQFVDILISGWDYFYLLEALGDGTYSRRFIEVKSKGITDVAVVDIDGNSYEDIVFTAKGRKNVLWMKNLGDSLSEEMIISEDVKQANSLYVSDLNRDSSSDVIATSGLLNELSWFKQTDKGFGRKNIIHEGATAEKGFAFIKSDKYDALNIVASGNNQINVFPRLFNEYGNPRRIYSTKKSQEYSPITTDLDGDEDKDIIVQPDVDMGTWWIRNNQKGHFSDPTKLLNYLVFEAAAADFNQDGYTDIAITNGGLNWLGNEGGNTYSDSTNISARIPGQMYVRDVDSDNALDIIGMGSNLVYWFENMGKGSFTDAIIIDEFEPIDEYPVYRDLQPGDLDEDGDSDIVVGRSGISSDSGMLIWYENTEGSFSDRNVISSSHTPRQIDIADINQDSLPEIFTFSSKEGALISFSNQGSSFGGVKTHYSLHEEVDSKESLHFKVRDIDGDQDADIVMYMGLLPYTSKLVKMENQTITDIKETTGVPEKHRLLNNYPNPFNPTTTIKFSLPVSKEVTLTVYNTVGQKIKTLISRRMPAGMHSVKFNATGLPSGVYIYQLDANNFRISRKMLLLK